MFNCFSYPRDRNFICNKKTQTQSQANGYIPYIFIQINTRLVINFCNFVYYLLPSRQCADSSRYRLLWEILSRSAAVPAPLGVVPFHFLSCHHHKWCLTSFSRSFHFFISISIFTHFFFFSHNLQFVPSSLSRRHSSIAFHLFNLSVVNFMLRKKYDCAWLRAFSER